MTNKSWTSAEDQALLDLLGEGKTQKEAGWALHRSLASIKSRLEILLKQAEEASRTIYSRRCMLPECQKKFTTTEKGSWYCCKYHRTANQAAASAGMITEAHSAGHSTRARIS